MSGLRDGKRSAFAVFKRPRGRGRGGGKNDPLGKIHHAARHSSVLPSIVRDSRIADYRCSNGREGPSRSVPVHRSPPFSKAPFFFVHPTFSVPSSLDPYFFFSFSYSLASIRGNKMPRESPSAIILALAELSEFSNSAKGCEDTSSKCCGAINGRCIMDGVRTRERQRSRSVRAPFAAFRVPLRSSRGSPRVNLIRPLLWFNAAHTEQCESSCRSKRAWCM